MQGARPPSRTSLLTPRQRTDGALLRTDQVKSRVTPRGNMKAARSVNHRGLPGGGGLRVCMRRPQQLCRPRGMIVRARELRAALLLSSDLFSLNCGILPRSRQPFPFSAFCFPDLGRLGSPAPRVKAQGVSPLSFYGPAAPCEIINCLHHIPESRGALHNLLGGAPRRLHTNTHSSGRLAPPRPPIPPLSSLTTRAYHTHTRAHFTPQH